MPTLNVTTLPSKTLTVTTPTAAVVVQVPQTITGILRVQDAPDLSGAKTDGVVPAWDAASGLLVWTPQTAILGPAAALAPATSARNVIQASADVTPLSVRARAAGQTADLFQAQNSGGTKLLSIDAAGRLNAGYGDERHLFPSYVATGTFVDIRSGTAGAPDTALAPPVKVARTLAMAPTVAGNPGELQSAITAITTGVVPNTTQAAGLTAIAIQASDGVPLAISGAVGAAGTVTVTTAVDHGYATNNYAAIKGTGVFDGVFQITVTGARSFTFSSAATGSVSTGTSSVADLRGDAAALFSYARMDVNIPNGIESLYSSTNRTQDLQYQNNIEIQIQNNASANDYLSIGVSQSRAMTIRSVNGDVGAGILFGRIDASTIDVGLGAPLFPSFGDGTGPFRQAFLRDDTHAPYAIRLAGAHTVASLAVAPGSGPVLIGQDTAPTGTQVGALLMVNDGVGSTATPIAYLGNRGSTLPHHVYYETAGSALLWFVSGGTNNYLAGTAAGDFGFKLMNAGKTFWMGGQTTGRLVGWSEDGNIRIATTGAQKIGLWGRTPIVQPTGRITIQNYVAAPRTFNRSSFTLADLADLVCEHFTSVTQAVGMHA